MSRFHTLMSILATAVAGLLPMHAQAQAAQPITLIVPFAPGGPSDQLARAIGQKMTQLSGTTVVVDNKPGGGGQIGASALKNAPANGKTLLIADIGILAVNRTLYKSMSFDTLKDFEPISLVARSPMLLLTPGASPARSAADLVNLAKSSPQGISYASQGVGIGGHLLGEMFRKQTDANFVHVPYRGAAPAVQDLLAGRVEFLFEVPAATMQYVKAGRLKALAVASDKRFALLPNVPTMAEAGSPNVSMDIWWAIVARAGTPASETAALTKLVRAAIDAEDVQARFADFGITMESSSPSELASLFQREIVRLGKVVQDSGASVD